jgi:hypothetical protein
MYRFDPKVKTLVAQEVEEVEELTHQIDEQEKQRPGYTPPRSARAAASPTPAPGPKSRTDGASGGRSRFRDLLAAAAEQQRLQQEAKSSGGGRGTNGNGTRGTTNGDRNGAGGGRGGASGGGGGASGGAGGAAKPGGKQGAGNQGRNRPAASKSNRKRRGR